MNTPSNMGFIRSDHELWFESLFDAGRALVFPCDAAGQVDIALMGQRLRDNYQYARVVVGREFSWPVVRRAGLH